MFSTDYGTYINQLHVPCFYLYFQNANILQAVLLLVKELDKDSLDIVDSAVKKRLDAL